LFVSKIKAGHRKIMLTMVTGIILAHATSILIYAVIYWALIHFGLFSDLSGNIIDHFPTYIYFSATTYSSLGVGDVFPTDGLRFLAGMEAINGLILITWSAAFTYFSIQKMREAHGLQENYCNKCAEK
jgi:succinate dehydrogenase hydrophobic anchor subunit